MIERAPIYATHTEVCWHYRVGERGTVNIATGAINTWGGVRVDGTIAVGWEPDAYMSPPFLFTEQESARLDSRLARLRKMMEVVRAHDLGIVPE